MRVFFDKQNEKYSGFADISFREIFSLAPAGIFVLFLGIYPAPYLNIVETSMAKLQALIVPAEQVSMNAGKVIQSIGKLAGSSF